MRKAARNATVADIRSVDRPMPIYTKTGDRGTTALYGGKRVSKSDKQVEAYGTIDELSSFIGLTTAKLEDSGEKEFLVEIQRDLYGIMARLSGAKTDLSKLEERIEFFEKTIDALDKDLPRLNKFIVPGGNEVSAMFHVLRVLTRRAERNVVGFSTDLNEAIKYLNRLSDLFFMKARFYGKDREIIL